LRSDSNWIQTFTGRKFWPLDPEPADIVIEDIAHALSLLCRFTGHVRNFYSIGEHSIRASYLAPEQDALWALLHDSSEAYVSDMSSPLKYEPGFGDIYRVAEKRLMACICERFGLPPIEPDSVRRADAQLLLTEKRDLLGPGPVWSHAWTGEKPLSSTIKPYGDPRIVESSFLLRFAVLDGARGR